MNSQFILNYTGSKFKETKELDNVNFDKYDIIIECFGGSYGFSRYLYKMRNYKNKKYIIYDNNKELIEFYLYIQDLIKNNKFNDFLNEYHKELDYLLENYRYKDRKKRIVGKDAKIYVDKLENENMKTLIYINSFRQSFIDVVYRNNLDKDFLDMFNNITFIHSDIINIDFTIYDKDKTLIYLDPPYLLENNTFYKDISSITIFYETIINLFKTNKTMFIHSYNYLLDYVFKEYNYMNYEKKYRMSNKMSNHIVYYND